VTPLNDPTKVVGHVVAYNHNLQDGYVYVAVAHVPQVGAGALEGLIVLIQYLFAHWPFRKIYVEAPEFNAHQFASAIRIGILREEGRLVDHRYYGGQFWDLITWAIYPADAETFAKEHPGMFVDCARRGWNSLPSLVAGSRA
jgi:RimJ/RimL family protein N-acetyltransferase